MNPTSTLTPMNSKLEADLKLDASIKLLYSKYGQQLSAFLLEIEDSAAKAPEYANQLNAPPLDRNAVRLLNDRCRQELSSKR